MLGGRYEIRIHSLHVARIGLAAPARHEALHDRGRIVDARLRHHRHSETAGSLRDEGHGHHGHVRKVFARGVVIDVEQWLQAPSGSEHGDGRLHVDADVA